MCLFLDVGMWVIIPKLEGYFNGYSPNNNKEGTASYNNGAFSEREAVVSALDKVAKSPLALQSNGDWYYWLCKQGRSYTASEQAIIDYFHEHTHTHTQRSDEI
jgi:hypothetical protein